MGTDIQGFIEKLEDVDCLLVHPAFVELHDFDVKFDVLLEAAVAVGRTVWV
jgi:hypothetical protein